jgi:hypothetical protein
MRQGTPVLDAVRQDWIHPIPAPVRALAVTLVVSLMHFWYDGFVWSARRKQV